MKLQLKVLAFCLSIGVVPIGVISWVAHDNATQALDESAALSGKALQEQALERISAICGLKASATAAYFDSLDKQLKAFAGGRTVVEAVDEFSYLFDSYAGERSLDDQALETLTDEVKGFYDEQFGKEFQERTGRPFESTSEWVEGLSPSGLILQHAYIVSNGAPGELKSKMDAADDDSFYSESHARVHPDFRNFQEQFGLEDILFCKSDTGEVIYSVAKGMDLGVNLVDGPLADSALAMAFTGAVELEAGETHFSDTRIYLLSMGQPTTFISTPVFSEGVKSGVVIFRIPMDLATHSVRDEAGLGEFGDSYLVGSDGLMRSDSRQDKNNRTVAASFSKPAQGSCNTEPVQAALKGEVGQGVTENILGEESVSAWVPIDILGTRWALIAEIPTKEALAVVQDIEDQSAASIAAFVDWILGSLVVLIGLVLAVGYFAGRAFLRPITRASDTVTDMGRGNLSSRIQNTSQDEIGAMTQVVDRVLDQLVEVFGTEEVEWVELGESIEKASGLAGMIEQAPLSIMQTDLTGKVTYVNQASRIAFASTGFVNLPSQGAEGMQVRDLLRIPKEIGVDLRLDRLPWTKEYRVDNESVELAASAINGADGNGMGIMVTWEIRTTERAIQEKVRETTVELTQFAGTLRISAQELLEAAESTFDSAARTQEGTREVNEDTQAVSSASDEMSNTVSSIAQSSRDLADAVEQAVCAGGRAVDVVGSLTSANDQISRVSETIANIADQTNLLALNATIEAAGAGEAGRGFAVVASEVKDLARETMTATKSIAEQVRDIAGRSQEVSEAIGEITRVVAGVSDLAMTLSTAVEEQDITTREISEATRRSANRVGTITEEMEELSNSAASANTGARSVLQAATELSKLAEALSEAGNSHPQ